MTRCTSQVKGALSQPQRYGLPRRQAGRALLWTVSILAIAVGVVGYWYANPGKAPGWVRGRLPGIADVTAPLYRWRDGQGQWQITDQPPQGRPYETVTYQRDANVIPSGDVGTRP